ncbi:hypothetical protein HanIR_Chr11g0544901 [Helianthus annuus]|nr:hypothetical protein HanIR_Chr11g0544901 [Helianthus annuus]
MMLFFYLEHDLATRFTSSCSTFSKICISKAQSSLHLASFGDEEALIGDDDEFSSKSNFFCQSSVDLGNLQKDSG